MLRLLKLLPDQIGEMWHVLKPSIEAALPPTSIDDANRGALILASLLTGRLDCMLVVKVRDDGNSIIAVVVVQVLEHVDSDSKTLFVYAMYGTGIAAGKDWLVIIDLIKDYARGQGCSRLSALSKVESVIKIMQLMGADTDYRLLTLEV
jgi:hypothetical protein